MKRSFRYKYTGILLVLTLLLSGCGLFSASEASSAPPETQPIPEPAEESPAPRERTEPSPVRITELMAKNRATLADEEGNFPDWVELENVSGEKVNLSGWHLSDRRSREGDPLPDRELEPGERIVLFPESFGLSAGETLVLFDPEGLPADEAPSLCDRADVSMALTEDGWRECERPTPGFPNNTEGFLAFQESLRCPSPLEIYEVAVANFNEYWAASLGESDWIEVRNVSDGPVCLSEYYISDDRNQRLLWQLPERSLEPGGIWLVRCDRNDPIEGESPVCPAFSLDDDSDRLYLSRADGSLCDYVSLRNIPYMGSYGRMDGESGWFYFLQPTPGTVNQGGLRRWAETPSASLPDGVYEEVETLSVTLSGPGQIHYTLDGSLPTEDSPLYEEPLSLEHTTVLRAVAFEDGALPSRALNLSYFLNEHHSLPVLSLVTDDRRDFEHMYLNGRKFHEIPGNLALYEEGGGFSIPCGVKMHGETSLVLSKKNMSVRFRGAYGQGKLEYDIYGGGVSSFRNLVLRAGQDYTNLILRNELCENMALSASDSILVQRNRYCILYVNGSYYGIYALTEKTNEQMAADWMGVDRDSVTVLESQVGSDTEMFRDLFSFCMLNDLTREDNYRHVEQQLDLDSLIDWCLIEGWCANADLTYGNLRYCRSTENDGKWRLIFYDLDSTLTHPDKEFTNIFSPYQLEVRQVSILIAPLLKNPEFRERLLTRAGELLTGPLSDEALMTEFERLRAEIAPEVARDYGRFQMTEEKWEWNLNWFRDLIAQGWAKNGVDNLCSLFHLSEEERAYYFPGL